MTPLELFVITSFASAHLQVVNRIISTDNGKDRCSSMSASGSGSEAGRKRRVTIVEDDWGDDVSILESNAKVSVGTIIFKICLGLIFICSASGAIVYSVINSEESQRIPADANATLYFPFNINQQCFNGTLTMMYRKGLQNGQQQYTYTSYGTDWVQDATKKRVFHRVGLNSGDWQYSYYVFDNLTFFQTKVRCTRMDQGYDEFIESMGLTYVRKQRDEEVSLNGHYKEVIVYEGEPPDDVSINGKHPSLIRGYSSEERNVTYGWELYFPHGSNFSLYKQEYWYPSMKSVKPDWDIFNEIPNSCF